MHCWQQFMVHDTKHQPAAWLICRRLRPQLNCVSGVHHDESFRLFELFEYYNGLLEGTKPPLFVE